MYTISRWIFAVLDIQFFLQIQTFSTHYVYNFPFNLCSSGHSISLYILTFRAYNIHNFPLNFRNSIYSIFLRIQTFRTYIMYTISRWIFAVLDIQFLCQSRHSVQIMYTISRWIFAILDIEFFVQIQTFHTYIMYTISRQFKIFKVFANPDIQYVLCIQFSIQFMQFWTFNFSIHPYIPRI